MVMKLSQYAKLKGISYQTARNWYNNGTIKGQKMASGTILIDIEVDKVNTNSQPNKKIIKTIVIEPKFKGEFSIGDLTVPCAVMEDGRRVIIQREIVGILTGNKKGGLDRYLMASNLQNFVPTKFKGKSLDQSTNKILYGGKEAQAFEATDLIDFCEMYLKARDAKVLLPSQLHLAQQSEIIVRSFAKIGIIAIIDEVTGYKKAQNEYQNLLKTFVQEEIRKYVKLFPESWFKQVYRLYGWNWESYKIEGKNHPQKVGWVINRVIYEKLPAGYLIKKELRKLNPKNGNNNSQHRDPQHLTDDGRETVSLIIGKTEMIMEDFADQGLSMAQAIAKIDDRMPTQNIPTQENLF